MLSNDLSGDFLALRAATTPERTAVVDLRTDEHWTFRALDAAAEQAAQTLVAAVGTADRDARQPDDAPRVGLLLSTRPAYVVALYGALRLGWTAVPLNVRLSGSELATRIDRVTPEVIVCENETADHLADALADASSTPHSVRSVDGAGDEDGEGHSVVDGTLPGPDGDDEGTEFEPSPPDLDETALLMFTSGTTGDPKGVRLTPRNLAASAVASALRLGVTPGDRWLCCLPMYHMGGLAPAFRTVIYGTELAIQREFEAAETARILAERGITGVSLVPTQLKRLLDVTDDLPAPDLRTVLLGGAPAGASLLDRAAAADVPAFPTYGLTETASQVATARPATVREHPGTVGQPLYGTRVSVRPHDGTKSGDADPPEPGERGELVVSGPTVTPGYIDEERTAAAFGPHGLHTGDLGYRDADGRLWVEGRVDDVILTGGELVSPTEVAEQIRATEGVVDAAVLGLVDEQWGERVAALVVPGENAPTDEALRTAIDESLRERLADYKRPKTIALAPELPRTQSGTVDREAARERLRARRSRPDRD